ncbi:transposase [Methylobacterium isbiliense]|uniref:transposase n=1 Tax=Methylobacterium isbiliense TaxID=315478 RepID=UPI003570F848
MIKIKFAISDCRACPLWPQCKTADFAAEYAQQAGVEATIAQGVRSSRLRRTPYFGHAKAHLAHLMTAAAMNLARVLRWLADEPKARTRHSAYARLHQLAT